MNAIYDKEADAMHIRVKKGKVHRTIEVTDCFLVDVNKKGQVLGFEMLFLSLQMSKKEIASTLRTGRIPVAA